MPALSSIAIATLILVILYLVVKYWLLKRSIPLEREHAVREFRKRGGRARVGTTVEQLAPFIKDFPYDPSDVRLLSGGPVDYVVFDGLSDGRVKELVFLDIKTGRGKLNPAQKQVQQCADLGRVRFSVFHVDSTGARAKPSTRVDEVLGPLDDEMIQQLRRVDP